MDRDRRSFAATCLSAVCAAVLALSSVGVAESQETPPPSAGARTSATPPPPCIPPGPPPVAHLLTVVAASRRIPGESVDYNVHLSMESGDVAAALRAYQGGTLVDAFPLANTDPSDRNHPVFVSTLRLKPGTLTFLEVVGWEYTSAEIRCWKPLRIPLGPVKPG